MFLQYQFQISIVMFKQHSFIILLARIAFRRAFFEAINMLRWLIILYLTLSTPFLTPNGHFPVLCLSKSSNWPILEGENKWTIFGVCIT